jgi:rubrerythrin
MKLKRSESDIILNVFDLLLHEEQRGRKFFADSSKFVNDLHSKALLEKLAIEENNHIDILKAERLNVQNNLAKFFRTGSVRKKVIEYNEKELPVFDLSEPDMIEIDLPLLKLFEAEDFQNLLQKISTTKILQLAMRIEFQNFKYLVESSKLMVSKNARDILLHLAQEEKKHFLWLQTQQKILNKI